MKQYITSLDKWFKALPIPIQIIIFVIILFGPSAFRYGVQHNSWTTYTDKRFGYSLEYPAFLWKRISYAGFPGKYRETHLLLGWPRNITLTHQIAIGAVSLDNPTLETLAAWGEERILEQGGYIENPPYAIEVNGQIALKREFDINGRPYQEVYFVAQDTQQAFYIRVSAARIFYNSSLADLERVIQSFRLPHKGH